MRRSFSRGRRRVWRSTRRGVSRPASPDAFASIHGADARTRPSGLPGPGHRWAGGRGQHDQHRHGRVLVRVSGLLRLPRTRRPGAADGNPATGSADRASRRPTREDQLRTPSNPPSPRKALTSQRLLHVVRRGMSADRLDVFGVEERVSQPLVRQGGRHTFDDRERLGVGPPGLFRSRFGAP